MNRLGKLMTMLNPEKTQMPTAEDALPGRSEPAFEVPERHAVLDTPLQPPFPDGIEVAYFALGCFWGAERLFWELDGVYTTAVGYMNGTTPNPTYEEVCSGQDRPRRGGAGRLRPGQGLLRRPAQGLLRGARPDPGHAPGQRRRHPVPLRDLLRQRRAEGDGGDGASAPTTRRCAPPATSRSRPRSSPPGPSTTPRTTTSSTCTRCRTATAAWPAPASPAASPPRPPRQAARPARRIASRAGDPLLRLLHRRLPCRDRHRLRARPRRLLAAALDRARVLRGAGAARRRDDRGRPAGPLAGAARHAEHPHARLDRSSSASRSACSRALLGWRKAPQRRPRSQRPAGADDRPADRARGRLLHRRRVDLPLAAQPRPGHVRRRHDLVPHALLGADRPGTLDRPPALHRPAAARRLVLPAELGAGPRRRRSSSSRATGSRR